MCLAQGHVNARQCSDAHEQQGMSLHCNDVHNDAHNDKSNHLSLPWHSDVITQAPD